MNYWADRLYPLPFINADEKLDIAAWRAAGRPSPYASSSYPLSPDPTPLVLIT